MSDLYMKPGVDEWDVGKEVWDFSEWFDNDPDGWVVAIFEQAAMAQAESKLTEKAVVYILVNFKYTATNSILKQVWLEMFELWSNNLDEESKHMLETEYNRWLEEQ